MIETDFSYELRFLGYLSKAGISFEFFLTPYSKGNEFNIPRK